MYSMEPTVVAVYVVTALAILGVGLLIRAKIKKRESKKVGQ